MKTTELTPLQATDTQATRPWVRRSTLALVAAAAAAAITVPVALTMGDDSPTPEPRATSNSGDPSPEAGGGVTLDLDGDGDDDQVTVTGAAPTWLVDVTLAGSDAGTSQLTIGATGVEALGVTGLGAEGLRDALALAVTTKRGALPMVVTWTSADGVVLVEPGDGERLAGRDVVMRLRDDGFYVWRPNDAGPNLEGEVPVDIVRLALHENRLVADTFDILCVPPDAAPESFPQECIGPVGAEGEILPVPLDLTGVTVDLDGDGSPDELHVDTLPNTDGVTTSYEVWARLTSTGKVVSSQMTGETPNYVSFKGVVDADGDGRDEIVLLITPGGDLATAHVHGLVGRNLQLLEWPDDTASLHVYESGDDADNIWILDDRLLSGATTNAGADWRMWEWTRDGPSLFPTSLGTFCGEQPAATPPLDPC